MEKSPTPDLALELRRLADSAADRTLAALHSAVAHRADQRRMPADALEDRLARCLGSVPASLQLRLPTRVVQAPVRASLQVHTTARPQLRWPVPLVAPGTPTTCEALELRLLQLRCIEDTHGLGTDKMSIGLVRVVVDHGEPVMQATDVQGPFALGEFTRGHAHSFSPPRILTTITPGVTLRTVTAALVLAETDLGGLGGLLQAMASGVTDELIFQVAQSLLVASGALLGVAVGSVLGSVAGPLGTVGGSALGAALGSALGFALSRVIEGVVHLVKDDPLSVHIMIQNFPSNTAPGLVEAQQPTFTGRHARYSATLEWRAR